MTAKYLYAGSNIADGSTVSTIKKGRSDGLDSVADGSTGAGTVIVRDPSGTDVYEPWKTFAFEEDACSQPRGWTGVIVNVEVSRGDYVAATQRIWTFDLFDLNTYLNRQILHNTAVNNRPRESADDRIAWLLGSEALAGVVFDNGFIEANPFMYDAYDGRGAFADAVLSTLSTNSVSDESGAMSCIIWDPSAPAGEEVSLFYNHSKATTHTSSISLSNRDADVNNTDCFWFHPDPPLARKGEDIYCGVYFTTKNGSIYRHSDATHLAWFADDDIHRDGTFSTDRISLGATAESHAQKWLSYHSGLRDTVTGVAKLTAAVVNLIDAGMRVLVTLPQLPGLETATYLRVQRRGLAIVEGRNSWYNVRLELSMAGTFDLGGGDPGGAPQPPVGPAVHFYNGVYTSMSDNAGTAGGPGAPSPLVNTTIASNNTALIGFVSGVTYTFSMKAVGALMASPNFGVWDVVGGAWLYQVGPTLVGPDYIATTTFMQSTGATIYGYATSTVSAFGHVPQLITVTFDIDPVGWDHGGVAVPPLRNQWVGISPPELVVMTGSSGVTAWPFATGSLRVFYDIVEQTAAIVSYDGATGVFTMPSAPPLGTQVFVRYQGI